MSQDNPAKVEAVIGNDQNPVPEINIGFQHDLKGKPTGGFDKITWNVFRLLLRRNLKNGMRNRAAIYRANREAAMLRDILKSIEAFDVADRTVGINALESLKNYVSQKGVRRIKLLPNMDIVMEGSGGVELYRFNVNKLKEEKIIAATGESVKEKMEIVGRSLIEAYGNVSDAIDRKTTELLYGIEGRKYFPPIGRFKLRPIPKARTAQVLEGVRKTKTPPRIIPDKYRKLDVCSGYAVEMMEQVYGKNAVRKAGLVRYGKTVDAWDILSTGKDRDSINIEAGMVEHLEHKIVKSPQRKGYKTIKIKNKEAYGNGLKAFFEAGSEKYPALITAFQTDTKYKEQIWAANEAKSNERQSYNSHVMVVIGREDERRAEVVRGKIKLAKFLQQQSGVKPEYQKYLLIKVIRADGKEETVADNIAEKELQRIVLQKGDAVQWQDVLVTDFYKGNERVMGLGEYASAKTTILMDFITLKNEKQPGPRDEYPIIGFVQIENGAKEVASYVRTKLNLTDEALQYYLAALEDSGYDLTKIREKDILPKFDMEQVISRINNEGGLKERISRKRKSEIEEYQKNHPEAVIINIEPQKTPYEHIKEYFEPYFQGRYTLTESEKMLILDGVDQSCPNIKIFADDPKSIKFEAGDYISLTHERIFEIAKFVRSKQAEIFGDKDYIRILEGGDTPDGVIGRWFNLEAGSMEKVSILFNQLDWLEKSYVLKAFDTLNRGINLEMQTTAGGKRIPAKFRVGERAVFRKNDLRYCIETILLKRKSQEPNPSFNGIWTDPLGEALNPNERTAIAGFAARNLLPPPKLMEIPPKIKDAIDKAFPGLNMDEVIIRNALYFVYVKEQMGGGLRSTFKSLSQTFGKEIQSRGPFQLRINKKDFELCKTKLQQLLTETQFKSTFGNKSPEDMADTLDTLIDDPFYSAIIAGMRLKSNLVSIKVFMDANEEKLRFDDKNFAIMLITSHNRGIGRIYRAVFQNWAYNLSSVAGVESKVKLDEIDETDKTEENIDKIWKNIEDTFKSVVDILKSRNEIQYEGEIEIDLALMRDDKRGFVKSPLVKALNEWYTKKTTQTGNSRGLRFVFSDEELERGNYIFSFGRKYLTAGTADSRIKDNWTRAVNAKDLRGIIDEMKEDYQIREFIPEPVQIDRREGVKGTRKVEQTHSERPNNPEHKEPEAEWIPGNRKLMVYAKGISLRAKPEGVRLALLYFGTHLKVEEIVEKNGEKWLKVRVIGGEMNGKTGYVGMEKNWLTNENGQKLDPEMEARMNKQRNLPIDYGAKMCDYLRFIRNLNSRKSEESAKLMTRSKITAREITNKKDIVRITSTARKFGYKDQKFFGVLSKRNTGGLIGQHLYLIDTEENRILAFKVSTGRKGGMTPPGKYTAYSNGFRDLNYFGAHMGSYARKYRRSGGSKHFDSGRGKSGPVSMTTALIEVRNAKERGSGGRYFHGTNREQKLGTAASHGCIRMSNNDAVYLATLLNGNNMQFQIIT